MERLAKFIFTLVLVCMMASAVTLSLLSSALGDEKPKIQGKTLFEQKCLKCHKLAKFKEQENDKKAWELIINRMQRGNVVLTDEEVDSLTEYLAKEFGA